MMGLQGSRKARQSLSHERFSDGLIARGVLRDPQQAHEEALVEAETCPYCERPVHPTNYVAHMKLYHEEEWDGVLPRTVRANGNGNCMTEPYSSVVNTAFTTETGQNSPVRTVRTGHTLTVDPEFRDLIPPQTAEERAGLEASILDEGCREALVVWKGHNILVDGHHRYAICHQHGIPFVIEEKHFDSRDDVIIWMVRNQLSRRNISPFSRSDLALASEEAFARKAKANQATSTGGANPQLRQNSDKAEPVDTKKEVAKLADVSHDTIHKVKKVKKSGPKFVRDKARTGDLSVNRAYLLTKALENAAPEVVALVERTGLEEPEKVDILKRLYKSGKNDGSNGTFDEIARTGGFAWGDKRCNFIEAPISEINAGLKWLAQDHARIEMDVRRAQASQTQPPEGQYKCIIIDPPWPVEKIEREVRPNQGASLDYPTLTLDDIQKLPVSSLAADAGCHLYLWTTQKFLPVALKLVEAWGFHYQCLMTWVKPTGMTPYSWMYNTEHVIFARRGNLPLEQNGLKLSFEAASNGHSVKPEVFYERVLKASPGPRLDMFARRAHDGFEAWGDEVCNRAQV